MRCLPLPLVCVFIKRYVRGELKLPLLCVANKTQFPHPFRSFPLPWEVSIYTVDGRSGRGLIKHDTQTKELQSFAISKGVDACFIPMNNWIQAR